VNAVRTMRPVSRLAAGLATTAAVLALAACGGGVGDGPGSAAPDGASLVPASAPVFISIDTDFGSQGWQAANALIARFPSGNKLFQSLTSSLAKNGLDFDTDVKPALGPETDVALLALPTSGNPTAVLLTKPADPAKLDALLAKSEKKPAWKVVDGWYVVSDTQAAVDQALTGSSQAALADDSSFKDAIGTLSGSPIARVYVSGPAVMAELQKSMSQSSTKLPFDLSSLTGNAKLSSIAVGVTAEGEGVRVEGVAKTEGAPALATRKAELTSLVPGDALVYASFGGLDQGLKKLLDTVGQQVPNFDTTLSQVELALGVSIDKDVLPLFSGEGALYVRAGAPIPEVTLVLSPADPTKALATLDKLTGGIGALAGLSGGQSPFTTSSDTIAGVPVKKLSFGKFDLYYGIVKGHLVLTTAVKGIADLVAGSSSLAASPTFQQATQAAGLPEENAGFVYVDLANGIDALQTAGLLKNVDQEVMANLQPLQFLVAYATGEKDTTRFAGFLGIK